MPADLTKASHRLATLSAERLNYTIGEASERSGVSAKMIRYYESIGLVRPAARSSANYRRYSEPAVQTLRFVARARELGFSVEAISRLLSLWQEPNRASAEVKALALAHAEELGRKIAVLQSMQTAILDLAQRCHGDHRPQCPILEGLSGEPSEGAQ
jgi:Cu(I)-responsive transcriptional regulator